MSVCYIIYVIYMIYYICCYILCVCLIYVCVDNWNPKPFPTARLAPQIEGRFKKRLCANNVVFGSSFKRSLKIPSGSRLAVHILKRVRSFFWSELSTNQSNSNRTNSSCDSWTQLFERICTAVSRGWCHRWSVLPSALRFARLLHRGG